MGEGRDDTDRGDFGKLYLNAGREKHRKAGPGTEGVPGPAARKRKKRGLSSGKRAIVFKG